MHAFTRVFLLGLSTLSLQPLCLSQTPDSSNSKGASSTSGPTVPPLKDVNPEILKLVIDDQWDRGNDMFGKGQVRPQNTLDWKAIGQRDNARHKAIRDLLAAQQLKTVNDFNFASLIFQHSGDPSDLMLAHLLSSTSVAMGGSGKWLMAATMDRYLQSIKQPQIFGTQFHTTDGKQWTMEPYNRTTLTDAERALWCVVPLTRQQEILTKYQSGEGGASTGSENCK